MCKCSSDQESVISRLGLRIHSCFLITCLCIGGCSGEKSAELTPQKDVAVANDTAESELLAGSSELEDLRSDANSPPGIPTSGFSEVPEESLPRSEGSLKFAMSPSHSSPSHSASSQSASSHSASSHSERYDSRGTISQANPDHAIDTRTGSLSPQLPNGDWSSAAEAPAELIAPVELSASDDASNPSRSGRGTAMDNLPAGSSVHVGNKYATVKVYYATDRAPSDFPLAAMSVGGQRPVLALLLALLGSAFIWTCLSLIRSKHGAGALGGLASAMLTIILVAVINAGAVRIEKRGVTYTAERGILKLGVAEVTVPAVHEKGVVEQPSVFRFEFAEDPEKHIVMVSATEYAEDDFYLQLQDTLVQSQRRELLVFIHGYNVDFPAAVRRTAQMAVDLPFRGAAVCYSWPSQGTLLGYPVDENNSAWTASHLRDFLLSLAQRSQADSIHLVAHSMGNRALTSALSEISLIQKSDSQPIFTHVVMAAPDVDADYFRKDLAPRILKTAQRVTLYASSDDKALVVSKKVHGYPRAGESGPGLVVLSGVETIDVSGIDLSLLGHSYYGDSGLILKDLFSMLHLKLPAQERPLLERQQVGGMTYWRLHPAAVAGSRSQQMR